MDKQYRRIVPLSYDTANTLKIGDFLCSHGRYSQARSQLFINNKAWLPAVNELLHDAYDSVSNSVP